MGAEPVNTILSRIAFTVRMGARHRAGLARILRENAPDCRPWEISIDQCRSTGATIIALDFDGVLAPHGDPRPAPLMLDWLDRCVGQFGAENVFVLSNAPSPPRMAFFQDRFPDVRWQTGAARKPYPDGLEQIISLTRVAPRALLLVDDRLLTGALAACIADINFLYVRRPIVDLAKQTFKEIFFMTLRGTERLLLRWF